METENRQENIQYDMIFMLGGLWAAHFLRKNPTLQYSGAAISPVETSGIQPLTS